jgi:hypothetical protein
MTVSIYVHSFEEFQAKPAVKRSCGRSLFEMRILSSDYSLQNS